jgi:hypothetical protein
MATPQALNVEAADAGFHETKMNLAASLTKRVG